MKIKGKVLVASKDKDYYKAEKGSILVAKNTTPELTVVIDKIAAIVVETENRLCHAAIVAREYGKPILMGVDGVTEIFKTGDMAEIDFGLKKIYPI